MNFRSACALLVVGVALASGLSGLCEMVCAVAGVEHHRMSHGAASGHDHVGAPPATSAAAHAHHESDASSSASKCPHCPAGVDCMISPSALPLDAALTMGELPTSGLPAMYQAVVAEVSVASVDAVLMGRMPPDPEPPRA